MVDPNAATIAIVFAAFCWFGPDADQLKLIAPRQAAVPACWHEIFSTGGITHATTGLVPA
jgi:hypothetical protein